MKYWNVGREDGAEYNGAAWLPDVLGVRSCRDGGAPYLLWECQPEAVGAVWIESSSVLSASSGAYERCPWA